MIQFTLTGVLTISNKSIEAEFRKTLNSLCQKHRIESPVLNWQDEEDDSDADELGNSEVTDGPLG